MSILDTEEQYALDEYEELEDLIRAHEEEETVGINSEEGPDD